MNRDLTNAVLVLFAAMSAPALAGDNKVPTPAEKPGISRPGDYRVEVWVGDEKVDDEAFDIVSTRSARK